MRPFGAIAPIMVKAPNYVRGDFKLSIGSFNNKFPYTGANLPVARRDQTLSNVVHKILNTV